MSKNLEKIHSMPVWKSVLVGSIPAMMAMLMVLIYNMADLYFVGQTGDALQVTAVSIASPLFWIFSSIGSIFGVGGLTVCSQAFGSGDQGFVKKVSAFCFLASSIVGVIISLGMFIFTDSFARALGANEEVLEMVKAYIQILSLSGPSVVISTCMSNLLRAEGKAKEAMIGMMMGNMINIILDPIFILSLDLGVTGAAIATTIGNVCGVAYYILYLYKGRSMLSGKLQDCSFDGTIVKSVLAIGIPASLSTAVMSLSQVTVNNEMIEYGNLAVAGIGVTGKVLMITGVLLLGLAQGIQPLIAYCIGANNKRRYNQTLQFSIFLAVFLGASTVALCYMNLENIVGSFLSDAQAFHYAYEFTEIRLSTSMLFGVYAVLVSTLLAVGAAKSSLLLNVSRHGFIYIPAVFIMGGRFGMMGIVYAQPVADIVALILAIIVYSLTARKLFLKVNEEEAINHQIA